MTLKDLFKRKKKQTKEELLAIEKADTITEIVKLKIQIGMSVEQIRKEFIRKGYPNEFIDWILIRMKGDKEDMKLTFQEEVMKTLRLGKKYLIRTEDIDKTFRLIEKRINKYG